MPRPVRYPEGSVAYYRLWGLDDNGDGPKWSGLYQTTSFSYPEDSLCYWPSTLPFSLGDVICLNDTDQQTNVWHAITSITSWYTPYVDANGGMQPGTVVEFGPEIPDPVPAE